MNVNAARVVYEQAEQRPASPAIITDRQVLSYADLRRLVRVVASHLGRRGIEAGQTVGVTMVHRPLHLVVLLALAQLGAVSLPLHPAVPRERRLLAARRFGATTVVSGRSEFALGGLGFVGLHDVSFEAGAPEETAIHPATEDTPLRILISSGTSGDPKGMVLTHGLMAARNQTTEAGASASSRVLPMDMNFIIGYRPAMSALARGSAVVFPPSLAAGDILKSMVDHRVTHVLFSPMQARAIAAQAAGRRALCPAMACLRLGGGLVPPEVLDSVRGHLSPNVYVIYGSTESGMVTYATPEMLLRQPATAGRVCDWAELEVVGTDDRRLPPGTAGELRMRSKQQVTGYFHDESRNRRHFRDGWFYPGDLGRFDTEGLLYVEGRADDQMNIGGMKVNPEDIERTLSAHPAVVDCGAFAVSEGEGREMLAVALVLNDAAQLESLRAYARERLGPLAPLRFFVASALPRTATGKLRRNELAAEHSTAFSPQPDE
jgi:acyl-coenzyme A synthetase/AMP-(fatty) acid ligase